MTATAVVGSMEEAEREAAVDSYWTARASCPMGRQGANGQTLPRAAGCSGNVLQGCYMEPIADQGTDLCRPEGSVVYTERPVCRAVALDAARPKFDPSQED